MLNIPFCICNVASGNNRLLTFFERLAENDPFYQSVVQRLLKVNEIAEIVRFNKKKVESLRNDL